MNYFFFSSKFNLPLSLLSLFQIPQFGLSSRIKKFSHFPYFLLLPVKKASSCPDVEKKLFLVCQCPVALDSGRRLCDWPFFIFLLFSSFFSFFFASHFQFPPLPIFISLQLLSRSIAHIWLLRGNWLDGDHLNDHSLYFFNTRPRTHGNAKKWRRMGRECSGQSSKHKKTSGWPYRTV